jgi:hypothetical protein
VRDLQPENAGTLLSWSLAIIFAGDVPATIRPSTFASRKVIAAVAHTPGALGTAWQSDVRLFNRRSAIANVTAIFTQAGDEGWNHFAAVKLAIGPQQVMALDDVVAATMRTSGIGQLEFLGDTDSLVITSRTYTRANGGTAAGTYGQFIPAVSTTEAAAITYLPRIQSTLNFRTNIGFAETAGGSGTVRVTLFDGASGSVISQQDLPVLPFGQMQWAAAGGALITAELRIIGGDARIVAYSSVIDNRTGDPIYVPSVAPRPGTFSAPVISQPGVNTFWRSDIFLSALGDSGGSYLLTYTDAVTSERAVKFGTVGAHQVLALDDIVAASFGRTGFGSVKAELDGGLVATSRTATSSPGGTYGQFIPLRLADIGGSRELLHIERSSAFRTNLGALNTGGIDEVVRFTLYDASGHALGSTDRTVGALSVVQFSVEAITTAPIVDGRVEFEVLPSNGHTLAWASVIDNATGDPIFVPAQ